MCAGDLPAAARELFSRPGGRELFNTRGWYEAVIATALPHAAAPVFLLSGRGDVLLPLLRSPSGRAISGLTTPYTCLFMPLVRAGAGSAALRASGREFAGVLRRWGTVRIDALPENCPVVHDLVDGVRSGGLVPVWFRHFGNWHEPVKKLSWDVYLAGRNGRLRETIRRKLRRFERDARLRFRLITGSAELDEGVALYEDVYRRSWKDPEPYPQFNPALMRTAAAQGVLRLGLLMAGTQPVAAQFWVVAGGAATVLKLAHDEAANAHSPGTVLTAMMIRHLLATEVLDELDFGRGDDEYKTLWATQRRQRVGVVLANPRRPSGALFLARHAAGAAARALRR
jgi:hypothetical protein